MLLIENSHIHTLDPGYPEASRILIRDGKIVALDGDIDDADASRAKLYDLNGMCLLPGLTDAHLHLEQYALSLQKVDCETHTRGECLARVAERAGRTAPGNWILGHGWNQNNWEGGFGTAAELDAITSQHPVYLTAKSLHAGWANSLALKLANIDAASPDPPGGRIGRLSNGQPDGILYEGAMSLVTSSIPPANPESLVEAMRSTQEQLWRYGVTGVHDFDRRSCFVALQTLHSRGQLGLRVLKSIPVEDLPSAIAVGLHTCFGDDLLRIGGVKAFADGALGPRTAAMLQPYEGEPQNRGMLLLDGEEIFEFGRQAVENGLSLAIHAIGDRANHEVLEAFTRLRRLEADLGKPLLRHRIEHVQLIHPQDSKSLAALGVTASMQPIHATSDMSMADRFWGERARYSYAWRTQLEAGARLAFGSDAPVESPNPFWGLHAAVTRRRPDGSPGTEGWYQQEKLTLHEALEAYTAGAAYLAGMENRLGKLKPGYLADLIVLDRDPFNCALEELRETRPVATMVAGEWVFQS
jgi:predicted amidohydrolase YtcJ